MTTIIDWAVSWAFITMPICWVIIGTTTDDPPMHISSVVNNSDFQSKFDSFVDRGLVDIRTVKNPIHLIYDIDNYPKHPINVMFSENPYSVIRKTVMILKRLQCSVHMAKSGLKGSMKIGNREYMFRVTISKIVDKGSIDTNVYQHTEGDMYLYDVYSKYGTDNIRVIFDTVFRELEFITIPSSPSSIDTMLTTNCI